MSKERMTRAEWEARCFDEQMAKQERERIEALRGVALITYLIERNRGSDPVTAHLLQLWQDRASKNTAAALTIKKGERHDMPEYQIVADITLANGINAYASEAITGAQAYQISLGDSDLLWEHIIRYIVRNACAQLETTLMPTFMELAGPQI